MAHLPVSLSLSSLYHLQSGASALSLAILLMLFPLPKNLSGIYIRELHILQKLAPRDLSL